MELFISGLSETPGRLVEYRSAAERGSYQGRGSSRVLTRHQRSVQAFNECQPGLPVVAIMRYRQCCGRQFVRAVPSSRVEPSDRKRRALSRLAFGCVLKTPLPRNNDSAKPQPLTVRCRSKPCIDGVGTMRFDNERLPNHIDWVKVRSEFMPGLGRERKRVDLCALIFTMILRKRLTLQRHQGAVLL